HRRGADRTPHCLALIKHREINDHPIEVVAQYFASLQRHCKSSVLKRSDYAISAENDRYVRRRLSCGDNRASHREDDIHLESDKFRRDFRKALATPLGPAILDHNGAAAGIL